MMLTTIDWLSFDGEFVRFRRKLLASTQKVNRQRIDSLKTTLLRGRCLI